MDPHNIDFDRLAQLLDIVQKQASVAPQYTALGSLAMAEVKEINKEAQDYLNELGQERLREEQEATAELRRQSQEDNSEIVQETDVPQFPEVLESAPVTRRA